MPPFQGAMPSAEWPLAVAIARSSSPNVVSNSVNNSYRFIANLCLIRLPKRCLIFKQADERTGQKRSMILSTRVRPSDIGISHDNGGFETDAKRCHSFKSSGTDSFPESIHTEIGGKGCERCQYQDGQLLRSAFRPFEYPVQHMKGNLQNPV